jgi:hypothetical protein
MHVKYSIFDVLLFLMSHYYSKVHLLNMIVDNNK